MAFIGGHEMVGRRTFQVKMAGHQVLSNIAVDRSSGTSTTVLAVMASGQDHRAVLRGSRK
jgi:hypothetical protein